LPSQSIARAKFSHTRRPDEAQNRPLDLIRALLHGKIFENAFLDLFKTVMILVQNFRGFPNVFFDLGLLLPRDGENPIEIIADHRCLCRHRRHLLEFFEFAKSLFFRLFGKFGLADALFQFAQFVAAFLAELNSEWLSFAR
jgi:hypothetical protein